MARILVVDDRQVNRQLVHTVLGYAGHQLLEAGDGAEALALLETFHPDLVVSDIHMPTMDGVAFVHRLRSDPRFMGIPVLFLTATYQLSQARMLAEGCGAQGVLAKPCQPKELFDAVHDALGIPRFVAPGGLAADPLPGAGPGPETNLSGTLVGLEGMDERLAALVKVGLECAEERDASRLLAKFCRAAREVVCARYAVLGLLREDGQPRSPLVTSGLPEGELGAPPLPAGLLRQLLLDGRPRRVRATGEAMGSWGLPAGVPPFRAFLALRVASPHRTLGWLFLADRLGGECFSEEDEQLAATLATQLGGAYENLLLVEALQTEIQRRARSEESRAGLMEVLESAEDAIVSMDLGLRITGWNAGAEQLLGFRMAEVLGRPYVDRVPAEGREVFEGVAATLLAGSRVPVYEAVRLRKDGSGVLVAIHSTPIRDGRGRLIGITAVLRDLTSRRRLETSLQETATLLQNVFNGIAEVVWSVDFPSRRVLTVSPACERVLGHPPAAFLADPDLWIELLGPEDRRAVPGLLARLGEGQPLSGDFRLRIPGGAPRWVHTEATPIRDPAGAVIRLDGISSDVNERHLAEDALRASEAKFRSLVESVDDLVCTLDLAMRITGIYGRGADWMGGRGAGLLGKLLGEVLPPEMAQACQDRCSRVIQDGPLRFEAKDFAGHCFRVSAAPIQGDPGGPQGIVAVAHDLTEFLRLQERLSQQERLAALGSLVGSVAHDVRNPLMAIMASLDLIEAGFDRGLTRQGLAGLRKGVDRIAALMNELLDYAKPHPLAKGWHRGAELVEEAVQACQGLAGVGAVTVETRFDDPARQLFLDGLRFHQVLKNLLENAIQHSPPGGRVLLQGRLDPALTSAWLLTVEDEGGGIAPRDLPRLFDPFFSKRVGGTGLGLAICQRIVEQHGGVAWAENRPGGGACLALRIPLSD